MSRPIRPVLSARQATILLSPVLLLLIACGGDGGRSVRVFAASSLTEAFTGIAKAFEADNPGVNVNLDFGGSQRMRSQVEFGAKADVFASADPQQMKALADAGLISGEPVDFALNGLVVLASDRGPVYEVADLADPGARVALAQENVPAGSYSRAVLANLSQSGISGLMAGFAEEVLENLVSEEPSVRNVVHKVALGEVDAGIV